FAIFENRFRSEYWLVLLYKRGVYFFKGVKKSKVFYSIFYPFRADFIFLSKFPVSCSGVCSWIIDLFQKKSLEEEKNSFDFCYFSFGCFSAFLKKFAYRSFPIFFCYGPNAHGNIRQLDKRTSV